jgi:hypothetical protein
MIPPLPGSKAKGRNDQRSSLANNTLEPYLDQPLQDFDSRQNSPNRGQEPSTNELNTDGVLILALKELFQRVKDPESEKERVFIIRCSYFEIYNDSVYDLLNIHKELAFAEPL